MAQIPFGDLPDHGRLWVFPSDRTLSDREAEIVMGTVNSFLDTWAAHGVPLRCAAELRENQFLLIGVDIDFELPSGCSIDSLVNQLRNVSTDIGVSVVDHTPVWYRDGAEIHAVSRVEFREMAEAGTVTSTTKVFDCSLTTVHQLRDGHLERPASASWHGRVFFRDRMTA